MSEFRDGSIKHGWIVTKDCVEGAGGVVTRVGLLGPQGMSRDVSERLEAGHGVDWRAGDEDGNWYYYGRVLEMQDDNAMSVGWDMTEEAFCAPLDDFAMPDAGAVVIEHRNPDTKEWEAVIG